MSTPPECDHCKTLYQLISPAYPGTLNYREVWRHWCSRLGYEITRLIDPEGVGPYPFHDGHVQNRMRRASGDCVCELCSKPYWQHPNDETHLSGIDGAPYLRILCDGSLVKL